MPCTFPPGEWRRKCVGRGYTQRGVRSTYQLFLDHIKGTKHFDFEEAVVPGVPWHGGVSLLPHLDLLPAAVELLRVEDSIHHNKFVQFYKFVFMSLKPYFDKYDYVFFDCPPNVYAVTQNALFAADACVVPYVPDFLSLSGFNILAGVVDDFYDKVSGAMTGRPRPGILGLLVSHYHSNINDCKRSVHELELQLQVLKDKHLLHPKVKILQPYVRRSASVAESTNAHLPVCLHDEKSIGSYDYYELSTTFLKHLELFQ